jgi:XTP/dITP diphosphohydrolase
MVMSRIKQLYFITGNKGKFSELQQKVSSLDLTVIQKDLGYPEIQAETLEEVAEFGLNHIKQHFKKSFVIEDAGLFIQALQGFPGVYSKYVYYTIGLEGILKLMSHQKDKQATFRSVYAYHDENQQSHYFIGECHGIINREKRGSHGFGYDPIFIPNGDVRTFAEMTIEDKNQVSHRGNALDKFISFLTHTTK